MLDTANQSLRNFPAAWKTAQVHGTPFSQKDGRESTSTT